jgi:hypothetical protein
VCIEKMIEENELKLIGEFVCVHMLGTGVEKAQTVVE